MASIDSTSVRTRALELLCASKSQAHTRLVLATEFGFRADHSDLSRLVRSIAEGRKALLRPGRLRPSR